MRNLAVLMVLLSLGFAQPASSVLGPAVFSRLNVYELQTFLTLRTQRVVVVGELPVGLEKALLGKHLELIAPSNARPKRLNGLKAEVKVLPGLAGGQGGGFLLADGRFLVIKDAKGFVVVDSPQIAAIAGQWVSQIKDLAKKP